MWYEVNYNNVVFTAIIIQMVTRWQWNEMKLYYWLMLTFQKYEILSLFVIINYLNKKYCAPLSWEYYYCIVPGLPHQQGESRSLHNI